MKIRCRIENGVLITRRKINTQQGEKEMLNVDLGAIKVHLRMITDQFEKSVRDAQRDMKRAAANFTRLGKKMSLAITLPSMAICSFLSAIAF